MECPSSPTSDLDQVVYVIDRSTCLMCDLRLIRVALAHAVSTSSNQEQ